MGAGAFSFSRWRGTKKPVDLVVSLWFNKLSYSRNIISLWGWKQQSEIGRLLRTESLRTVRAHLLNPLSFLMLQLHQPNLGFFFGGNQKHPNLSISYLKFEVSQVAQWLRICPQCRSRKFDPWVGKFPLRRKWQPTPVFLPRKFYGQRNLASYSSMASQKSWTWLSD